MSLPNLNWTTQLWQMGITVYRLRSTIKPSETYVGITANLQNRIAEHNSGKSTHTNKFLPWAVEIAVWFSDEQKAKDFEKYLKSGSGRAFAAKHF